MTEEIPFEPTSSSENLLIEYEKLIEEVPAKKKRGEESIKGLRANKTWKLTRRFFFGKHKGKTVEEVIEEDVDYLFFMLFKARRKIYLSRDAFREYALERESQGKSVYPKEEQ